MTDQEILTKAIQKAVANGWSMFGYRQDGETVWDVTFPTLIVQNVDEDGNCEAIDNYRVSEVIFNHAFAQALWGSEPTCQACGDPKAFRWCHCDGYLSLQAWQYHLQHMVLDPQPVQYLAQFLEEKKAAAALAQKVEVPEEGATV
jgi:hypothetical protein